MTPPPPPWSPQSSRATGRESWLAALVLIGLVASFLGACSSVVSSSNRLPNGPPVATAIAGGAALRLPSAPALAPLAGVDRKVVALDPGHGGDEIGAAAYGLTEKDSNLDMAFRVKALLEAAGIAVVLTRESDHRAHWQPDTPQPAGYASQRLDLQRRIDIANAASANAFVSLHSNGYGDSSESGVEVWWDSSRPFAGENQRLAQLLLDNVIGSLQAFGYGARDRGLEDDVCWRGVRGGCFPIFVLGKARTNTRADIVRRGADPADLGLGPDDELLQSRATAMPGALVENLFITNPSDNAVLRSETGRDSIARGVANGILAFLSGD